MSTPSTGSEENHDPLLVSELDRRRIASGFRMTVALTGLVALIVLGLTGLVFFLVSRVFDSLTPAAAADLQWKARRGAIELSKTAEFGILVGDEAVIRRAASDYLAEPEVVNVVALSADGRIVFQYGPEVAEVREVLRLPSGPIHQLRGRLVAWAPALIEGGEIGRVAVAVSTARLSAGDALRSQISWAALFGGLVAMSLALGFVALYIRPVLRLTQSAFSRLEHTTQQALEAARVKAQFLANMSHEIRTPINAVVGLSSLMLDLPVSAKVRRYSEMIDASSRALLTIVNDVLDFSKLEADKYQIHRAACQPRRVVQEVAELLAVSAQGKGLDLSYRVALEVPWSVEADADRVRQVLTNLVGNAVKFTERGEVYIDVSVNRSSADECELTFEVGDSGVGVPEAMHEHIFQSFAQVDSSSVRKHGGTGLGLTISRQLVLLMGGEISLRSALGKGSIFSFTLPCEVVEQTSAPASDVSLLGKRALLVCDNARIAAGLTPDMTTWGMDIEVARTSADAEHAWREAVAQGRRFDVVLVVESQAAEPSSVVVGSLRKLSASDDVPIVLLGHLRSTPGPRESESGIAAQLSQPVRISELRECLLRTLGPAVVAPDNQQGVPTVRRFVGTRVLVVDDNEMNQFVATEQLERLGCTVARASDGQQALDAVQAGEYALVLMDCQMPVMDGYTAARAIREREGLTRHTPIVALTAHALGGERERVLEVGMDDYLTKPLQPDALLRILTRWVPGQGSELSAASAPPSARTASPSVGATAEEEPSDFAHCATPLLRLFLDKVPMQLEQLDGALAFGDLQETRAHAHKLKGSLLAVSATRLAAFAEVLQHTSDQAELAQAGPTIEALLSGFVVLERRIMAELSARERASRGTAHA